MARHAQQPRDRAPTPIRPRSSSTPTFTATSAGARSRALFDLVPDQELRQDRRPHQARRRARVLLPADGEPRRARPSGSTGPPRRTSCAAAFGPTDNDSRRPVRRRRLRRPRRRRTHHRHVDRGSARPLQARPEDDRFFIASSATKSPAAGRRSGPKASTTTATARSTRTARRLRPEPQLAERLAARTTSSTAPATTRSACPRRARSAVPRRIPNIAAFQSYHNTGGMILRGPAPRTSAIPARTSRVQDAQETANASSRSTAYMICAKDLYTVHGGEVNWAYEGSASSASRTSCGPTSRCTRSGRPDAKRTPKFRDLLQFGDVYVPYSEFEHPTLRHDPHRRHEEVLQPHHAAVGARGRLPPQLRVHDVSRRREYSALIPLL